VSIPSEKRRICADNALKCYGTAYIFERRARKIRTVLRIINFLGIATPALLGAVIAMQGMKWKHGELVILIAGIVGAAQLMLSIWSLVTGWENSLAYAIESKSDNYRLADEFHRLGQTQTLSDNEFEIEMQVLETQAEIRSGLDNRVDVSDAEKRIIMRAGLWKFQRPCVVCNEVPVSMKPTGCGNCGNAKKKRIV